MRFIPKLSGDLKEGYPKTLREMYMRFIPNSQDIYMRVIPKPSGDLYEVYSNTLRRFIYMRLIPML